MVASDISVAGVDGCPGGWVVVTLSERDDTAEFSVEVTPTLDELVATTRQGSIAIAAIDMPIGLLDSAARSADTQARRFLGPRRSSIFPTPVRAVLHSTDYVDACERSRATSGRALSLQAFHLLPKIRQLDALVTPEDQGRIVEAHPECAFARLAGAPLPVAKATATGRALRRRLLEERFGAALDHVLSSRSAPLNDLLDAAVLALTALHVFNGTEVRLGDDVDATGLRAQIVY